MSLLKRTPDKKKAAVEDVIIFHVGEMRFAIAAQDVEEIRNIDGLVPRHFGLDARLAKVKATLTRNKSAAAPTYYVVDSALHFQLPAATSTRLLVMRGHPVAVLADSVDRMMQVSELHALPHAFQGAERTWYRGLAVLDGKVIPMLEPGSFLLAEEMQLLANMKADAVSA
jgi:chemotaxis signal transduction protein